MSVFISHSGKDLSVYSALKIVLDSSNIPRWDVNSMLEGRSLSDQLQDGLSKSCVCIFVATKHSIESQWCSAEVGAFWGAKKPVIIYIADSTLDNDSLPPQFRGMLHANDAERLILTIKKYLLENSNRVELKATDQVRQAPIYSNVPNEPIEPEWGAEVISLLNSSREAALNKQFEAAFNYASKAAEISPECPRAHGNKATALVHMRRYSEADKIYDYICKKFPENTVLIARTLHNKAWLLISQYGLENNKVLEQCKELYLSSLALDNQRLPTRAMALLCFALLGENESADLFLKSSLQWEGFLDALKKQIELIGHQGFNALGNLPEWLKRVLFPIKQSGTILE